jgi:hypothetical protein
MLPQHEKILFPFEAFSGSQETNAFVEKLMKPALSPTLEESVLGVMNTGICHNNTRRVS